MKLKGRGCHRRACADRSGHSFNWCLLQIAGASKINLKGDWAQNKHSHWFSCWITVRLQRHRWQNFKWQSRGQADSTQQIATIVMFGVTVWLTGPVELTGVGSNKSVRMWSYSSGLMRDKTKPESIVIVTCSSSNTTWNYCRISAGL